MPGDGVPAVTFLVYHVNSLNQRKYVRLGAGRAEFPTRQKAYHWCKRHYLRYDGPLFIEQVDGETSVSTERFVTPEETARQQRDRP